METLTEAPPSWDEISAHPQYQSLPFDQQLKVVNTYADTVRDHALTLPGADPSQVNASVDQWRKDRTNAIAPEGSPEYQSMSAKALNPYNLPPPAPLSLGEAWKAGGPLGVLLENPALAPASVIKKGIEGAFPLYHAAEALPGAAGATARGAVEGAAETASGLSTPQNVALLGTGFLGKTAQRLISAGFSADMLAQVPDQVKAIGTAEGAQERAKKTVELIGNLVFGVAAGAHALKGGTPFTPDQVGAVDKASNETLATAAADKGFRDSHPEQAEAVVAELRKRQVGSASDQAVQIVAGDADFAKRQPDEHALAVSEARKRGLTPITDPQHIVAAQDATDSTLEQAVASPEVAGHPSVLAAAKAELEHRAAAERVGGASDQALAIAAGDQEWSRQAPVQHAAVVAELGKRGLEPVAAEDVAAARQKVIDVEKQAQEARDAGLDETADELLKQRDAAVTELKAKVLAKPETVAAAAVKINGELATGVDHGEAFSNYAKAHNVNVDDVWSGKHSEDIESGFTTSTGRFVDLEEAAKIAKKPNANHADEILEPAQPAEGKDGGIPNSAPVQKISPSPETPLQAGSRTGPTRPKGKGASEPNALAQVDAPSAGGGDSLAEMSPEKAAERYWSGKEPTVQNLIHESKHRASDLQHSIAISKAAESSKPVNAAAVEQYGIKLPEGYTKEGDLYIFRKEGETPNGIRNEGKSKNPSQETKQKEVLSEQASGSTPAPTIAESPPKTISPAESENASTSVKTEGRPAPLAEKAVPEAHPKDKVYEPLLKRSNAVGPNLYELTEKQITPALRQKLNLNGRPEETPSFSLRPKGDVTGNPSDRGWILKDKRPDFAARAVAEKTAAPDLPIRAATHFERLRAIAQSRNAPDADAAASDAIQSVVNSKPEIKNDEHLGALLSRSVNQQISEQFTHANRQKRGGGAAKISLNEPVNEGRGSVADTVGAPASASAEQVSRYEDALGAVRDVTEKVIAGFASEHARATGVEAAHVERAARQIVDNIAEKDFGGSFGLSKGASGRPAEAVGKLVSDVRFQAAVRSGILDKIFSSIRQKYEADVLEATRQGLLPQGLSKAFNNLPAQIKAAAQKAISGVRDLAEFHDFRRAVLDWSARGQFSTGEIRKTFHDLKAAVPDRVRREGIVNWIQADGDKVLLADRATKSTKADLKDGYEAAMNLTPEELTVAQQVRDTYADLLKRAQSFGIEIPELENYVTQIWKRQPLKEFAASTNRRLSESIRFAKKRYYDSFFDGEQAGLKPQTKDIADLLTLYQNEINNAVNAKQFVADLSKGVAKDGRPLLTPRGGGKVIEGDGSDKGVILTFPDMAGKDTTDYKVLEQPALHAWKWVGEENGKPIMLKGDLAVHPEVHQHLKNMLGSSAIREWYRSPSENPLGDVPKALTKFFVDDVQQVAKATMLGFFSPFHAVQEGTHAVGHRVNPFFNLPEIDLTKPDQMDAAQHGLMILPDRISAQQFREGLDGSSRNLLVNTLGKVGGPVGRTIKEWSAGFQNWLFESYIPGLKMKTYEHMLDRNQQRYADDLKAGTVSLDQIKYLSGQQSNAAFGHLNYADMGRNPTMQHFLQMAVLAPDFLEARTRFVGQAVKGVATPAGREQLVAIATLAATFWVTSRVLNSTLDGDPHWDEPFGVVVGNRKYLMRSVPEDIWRSVKDTRKFVYGRLSPFIGRGTIEGLSGVNYRGEPTTIGETFKNLVAGMIPLTVQPFTRGATETAHQNPVSPWEQFAGTVGVQVSRHSPATEIYKDASAWIEKRGKEFGIDSRKAVYPISKYQQLRYALEDNDAVKAHEEYAKLVADGKSRDKVEKGFKESLTHPFTGSLKSDLAFRKDMAAQGKGDTFNAAVKRRKEIAQRFHNLDKSVKQAPANQ